MPFIFASPRTLIMSPRSAERSEDLPEPTVPTTATREPSVTFQLMSCNAQPEDKAEVLSLSFQEKLASLISMGLDLESSWLI